MKKIGILQAYQWEFSSANLELPNMAEKDNLFYFIIELKPWVHNEVKRIKYQDTRGSICTS